MPYTYDYTSAAIGDESVFRRYWRFAKMTLTRWTRAKTFVGAVETIGVIVIERNGRCNPSS